ncbi:MAG: beta-propeller fold lactonase family protein [Geminicoccaceae bacterium]
MTRFLLTSVATIALCLPVLAQERDLHGALSFEGRYLVSVQDADMLASAYVNGQLGPREGRDSLAVIPLDGDPRDWTASEIFASNSVAGPPAAIAITPDGRFAYVIETFTPRPDNDEPHTFGDLQIGTKLAIFDLSTPATPALVETIEVPGRPLAVRANATGELLAVTYSIEGGAGAEIPLQIFPINADGTLDEPTSPVIEGWPMGQGNLIDIDWHPEENVIAFADQFGNTLRFARVADDLSVIPFGNVVDIERTPFRLFFTPDGNHVVVNALYWGPDIQGTWSEAPVGSVLTVRVAAETRDDGTVRHAFIDRVKTGVSPEGLAVSPDGRWVATTNLERSYLPYDDPRITWFSSITLARLDQETGQLSLVGTFNYDGILPEAAVFDNSGNYLAVANYDHFDDRRQGSSIDFWRIQEDPLNVENVQLIKTEHSVPVARGAHSMVIAR